MAQLCVHLHWASSLPISAWVGKPRRAGACEAPALAGSEGNAVMAESAYICVCTCCSSLITEALPLTCQTYYQPGLGNWVHSVTLYAMSSGVSCKLFCESTAAELPQWHDEICGWTPLATMSSWMSSGCPCQR